MEPAVTEKLIPPRTNELFTSARLEAKCEWWQVGELEGQRSGQTLRCEVINSTVSGREEGGSEEEEEEEECIQKGGFS